MTILYYILGVILRILLIPLLLFSVLSGWFICSIYMIFSYILWFEIPEETENKIFEYVTLWPLVLYSKIPGIEIYRKK